MINFMSNLKVRVSQFRVQESQTSHCPRHIRVYFLLTLQRIADVGSQGCQSAVGQVVRDVPMPATAILDAHVAQHGIEVIHLHVKRLGHLRRRQCVLSFLVQHAQSLADDVVGQSQNLLRFGQAELLATLLFLKLQFLPPQHQLRTCLVVELCGDVQALGLGERIAGYLTRATVRLDDGSGCQRKIAPTYLFLLKDVRGKIPHILFTTHAFPMRKLWLRINGLSFKRVEG